MWSSFVVAVVVVLAAPAVAGPVRLIAADPTGVTLELTLPPWSLGPVDRDGRAAIEIAGLMTMDVPGRARVPFASELIALPPGALATVTVIGNSAEEIRPGTAIAIGDRPFFRSDGAGGWISAREPVPALVEGPWPRAAVELGEPFSLRRQRMVAVRMMPFRYDESIRTLWVCRVLRVRVEFTGATASTASSVDDRHWDSVLRETLLNYEQGRTWREPARLARVQRPALFDHPVPSGAAAPMAFDESFPEVRVKIDTTGLHRIRFADVSPHGFPAGVPITQVSVHRHEFLEGAIPPYATIELPIEVEDLNNNTVFDGVDRITVFAQNWAERSRASVPQRAWGDAEVLYVTQVAGAGLRMASRSGWRDVAGLAPQPSYPWQQRWERNFHYFPIPPDTTTDQFHWTSITHYYQRDDTLRFETNHLDTSRAATVGVTMIGRRDAPHFLWAQYHAGSAPFLTIVDSLSWFARWPLPVAVTLPGSTLGEGNTNTIRMWAKSGGPPHPTTNNLDHVGLNSIDVTYWRRYRALANYLGCNSADAAGESQFRAEGFTSSAIRVYDVTDSLNPVRLTLDPSHIQQNGTTWDVEFQDSLAAGVMRSYVAALVPRLVPASHYSSVTRRRLTARSAADYLLIVPEAFLPGVDPLVTLRRSQGLDVMVAPLEGVLDEFGGGRKSSHAIKRFTRYAYDNWNARFVLLVGDGSEDPQNLSRESGPDWIPIHKILGPVPLQADYEIIPSDPWYVCMNNCSLINAVPALQDMFIGRLPVNSLAETQDVIAKIVGYETVTADEAWRRNVLLNGDDDYSSVSFFGGGGPAPTGYCRRPSERVFDQINRNIADMILNQAGLAQMVMDTLSLSRFLEGVACVSSVPSDTCVCKALDATRQITHASVTGQELITRLNAGRVWWNFQGHANEYRLTHEDLFVSRGVRNDRNLLANGDRLFLFTAFSCHSNAFARYADQAPGLGASMGEDLVVLPANGAIGSWASSGYEVAPFEGGNTHINLELARALFVTPPHDEFLQNKGARVLLGEAIALALARYVPTQQDNNSEKGIALTYHLLGDPASAISIGEPQAMVLANQVPVTDGQPVRLHTVGDTLRIEADLVSNVEIQSIALERTDGAGTVEIPDTEYTITPAIPDTAASGLGGRRYHLSYGATLAADSYHYTLRTADRYNVPGDFDVAFQFLAQLRVDDTPIADGDPVAPTANLALRVLSPRPLAPATDLTLTVNGINQPFTAAPVAGDPSGREWTLSWTHAPYPIDNYDVRLTVVGGTTRTRRFSVVVGGNDLALGNLVAFPNPFDEGGTAFSFVLTATGPADIQIRVFTQAGRLVYERLERGMAPGYHQLPWNGLDDEGDQLANGVYFYRVLVAGAGVRHEQIGRLVKLRRPRREG